MRIAVAVIVISSACAGRSRPPADQPISSCAEVGAHLAGLVNAGTDVPAALGDLFGTTATRRCEADRWSDEVRDCIAKGPEAEVALDCMETLSADQRVAFDDELGRAAEELDDPELDALFGASADSLAGETSAPPCDKPPCEGATERDCDDFGCGDRAIERDCDDFGCGDGATTP